MVLDLSLSLLDGCVSCHVFITSPRWTVFARLDSVVTCCRPSDFLVVSGLSIEKKSLVYVWRPFFSKLWEAI